jgi:ATP-dependent RNA helicase DeaD
MTTEFTHLDLDQELEQAVSDLGYSTPTQVQDQVIPLLLEGKDVIAQSETGSGKTAAFALPILQNLETGISPRSVQALILAPTRELAIQVADAIGKYGQHLNVEVMAVYGGQRYDTSKRRIRDGVDVIVGTPGRLQDLMGQGLLDLSNVQTVVLDEADEMLSMGFIEDIENILSQTPSDRQTALFSATMPKSIRDLADQYMHEPETVMILKKQMTVATTEQRFYLVNEKDKLAAMTRIFEVEEVGATLVFTRTRAGSGKLAADLIQRGFAAEALNGDLAQEARIHVLNRFRSGQVKVLVATDVAARGLDIEGISHVVNYDIPNDPEAYVHRIGRTGRAGREGVAISLVTPRDRFHLTRIERYTKQKIDQAQLPGEAQVYAHREDKLVHKLTVWLERDRAKREQEIVEQMMAEGHDPVRIAAAALKMARVEEHQRPVEKIDEVDMSERSRGSRRERSIESKGKGKKSRQPMEHQSRPSRAGRSTITTVEEGMVRLSIGRGRQHGIRPGEVVGTIASCANIPGSAIGKIMIQDNETMLDVQEEYVSRVLGHTGSYSFRDYKNVTIKRA